MNSEIFTGLSVLYTIDNYGNSTSIWDVDPTGEYEYANISFSGGLTFELTYPLWFSLGLGLGYYTKYDEVDEYYSDGDFYETVWMRNTDETTYDFFPEAGLYLKVSNALVLKYGIIYHKGFVNQFGFGFQL